MSSLIVDASPIFYSSLMSATAEAKREGSPLVDIGADCLKVRFDYKEQLVYRIIKELSTMKTQFGVDEVVLATDNSKGGYWRKDYYPIYKGHRKSGRDNSEIDWGSAFEVFSEIKTTLTNYTKFKVLDIPRVEGDDIMFILSEYLSSQGKEVILHSLDHDTVYNLKNPGVRWWRHVKSTKKPGSFQEVAPGEILNLELEHIIQGDPGDNIKNIKAFSKFSPEFKKMYPNLDELKVYPKRFEVDEAFMKKYNTSAYKHPRYGAKMFLKSKKTLDDLLEENPIYKLNYIMNKKIALPEGIPQEIRKLIIDEYNESLQELNGKKLTEYFLKNKSTELLSTIALFG